MKREELYDKVMEISTKYGLPVRINKKTKKAELQKMYNNMNKLATEEELIEVDNYDKIIDNDIQDLLKDYRFTDEEDNNDDNDDDDENFEIEINEIKDMNEPVEIKQPRKIKSSRMTKLLKKSINSLKREINTIVSNYNKETDDLMNAVEEIKDITEGEIDVVINNYNEIREDAENEINLAIDTYEGEIPDSFYVWVESQLDRKKRRLEKILS